MKLDFHTFFSEHPTTLRDVLPPGLDKQANGFTPALVSRYLDQLVYRMVDPKIEPWPGKRFKNIQYWFELYNDYAIGINRNSMGYETAVVLKLKHFDPSKHPV